MASIGSSSKEDLYRHGADDKGEKLAIWSIGKANSCGHGAEDEGEELAWTPHTVQASQIHTDTALTTRENLTWTPQTVRARKIHTRHGDADQ